MTDQPQRETERLSMAERPARVAGNDRQVSRPRGRAGKPSFAPVFWGSISLFGVMFAFLTYQLTAGRDPSLAAAGGTARPVVLRKVVKRRVVTTVVPTPGSTSISSGPVTTSSAGAVSAYGSGAIVTGAS